MTLDKYEINLKLDQMKSLCAEESYEAAAEIADSINWSKIKNVNALTRAGETYEKIGRYDEAKELLLMAYDRSPIGRTIIYKLAEVAIKMKDFEAADEYYREFVEIAPHDNLKYILKYSIKKAEGADLQELIPILEEFKSQDYMEEWAYELAYLYHKAGMSNKCIEACDELILWFGDGPYVERALELKMLYQPLTKSQEDKYRQFRKEHAGITEVQAFEMEKAGEYGHDAVEIPPVSANAERFNTMNLQKEIAKGMQQILDATEKETVSDTMKTIKKMVEEIPYLQIPREEQVNPDEHIETDEEIDGSLRINFQELIGEENDGQMSLMVKESNVEKQITGQMSIEDVLEEWEKTKHAAEIALREANQRKLESAKARALHEAEDLMDRLQDVIPKLDAGVTPKELLEEQYLSGIVSEEKPTVPEVTPYVPQQFVEEEPVMEAPQATTMEVAGTEATGMDETEIEETTIEAPVTDEAEVVENQQPEEDLEQAELKELVAETSEVVEEAAEEEIQETALGEAETAAIEEGFASEAISESTRMDTSDNLKELFSSELPTVVEELKATVVAEDQEVPEPYMTIAEEEIKHTGSVVITDEDIEKANELGKTQQMPSIGDIQRQQVLAMETIKLPVVELEQELLEEEKAKRMTELPDDLKSVFSYFVPVKGMEDQLCQAMNGLMAHLYSEESAGKGNLIIQGGKASGKTVLATSMIKALQKQTGKLAGKIGKISAGALNQKDIGQLLKKVAGGCLIIEDAGEISRETAVTMSLLLEHDNSGLLIILEDTTKGIKKALSSDDGFSKLFSEKITVPIFTNDELVAFAKAYAKELGYQIEEMAVLALYNRISNIQRLDQATTLTEVKEIVDGAIEASEKGGIKKAFSMLTSRRYSEDNRIILKERDFEE